MPPTHRVPIVSIITSCIINNNIVCTKGIIILWIQGYSAGPTGVHWSGECTRGTRDAGGVGPIGTCKPVHGGCRWTCGCIIPPPAHYVSIDVNILYSLAIKALITLLALATVTLMTSIGNGQLMWYRLHPLWPYRVQPSYSYTIPIVQYMLLIPIQYRWKGWYNTVTMVGTMGSRGCG